MAKKGQLQLSFGMIFSIIIIIATIAVAFFFIRTFLGTTNCTQVNLFNSELQNEIDKVWRSPQAQQVFKDKVPNGIERICFGDINLAQNKGYNEEYIDLRRYGGNEANLFFYPSDKSCDGDLASKKIEHIEINDFFCIESVGGEISLKLIKENSKQRLVRVEA